MWMLEHYKRLGVSGRQLCERAGLNPTSTATWSDRFRRDPDADLSLSSVRALRKALGVPWEWIADNEGWPSEEIQRQFEGDKPVVRALHPHKSRH
jgi:hypothetical protein